MLTKHKLDETFAPIAQSQEPLPPNLQRVADAGIEVVSATSAHIATNANNVPSISATKATKESIDVVIPAAASVLAVWLSGRFGDSFSPEAIAAVLGAFLTLWKFSSKFYRDYTKLR